LISRLFVKHLDRSRCNFHCTENSWYCCK